MTGTPSSSTACATGKPGAACRKKRRSNESRRLGSLHLAPDTARPWTGRIGGTKRIWTSGRKMACGICSTRIAAGRSSRSRCRNDRQGESVARKKKSETATFVLVRVGWEEGYAEDRSFSLVETEDGRSLGLPLAVFAREESARARKAELEAEERQDLNPFLFIGGDPEYSLQQVSRSEEHTS